MEKKSPMEQSRKPTYRYCVVPMCKNTIRNTPDKVFFLVPRGADIRKKWCKIMNRGMVSPSACLYCCEDHFDIEEDTDNYMRYKIMNLQEKQKTILRLKKGILPHKFECQKDIPLPLQPSSQPETKGSLKRKCLVITKDTLSGAPVEQSVSATATSSSSQNYLEAGTSSSSLAYIEDSENQSTCEAGCSTISNVNSEKKMHFDKAVQVDSKICCRISNLYHANKLQVDKSVQVNVHNMPKMHDKAIQVNRKVNYRSKGVNVNLCVKTKTTAVSPIPISTKTTATSPLRITPVHTTKRKLFESNTDVASVFSTQPSQISSSFEPDTSSLDSSWVIEDGSEKETQFKNNMRSCMLMAIDKEPKMMLGLPKKSFHLIKLLSENIPLPTIDILITLKKIKLNESFSILALQFGYAQSTVSRIFSKSIPLLAEKMKSLIVWPTPEEIFNNLPIAFRARYSNVVSIIDCLEIQIEKPSDAVHQSVTWSQYKKCNTLKYLISCTPDGLINFISVGYGGRATDLMIVEDCGFLDCLPPKTAVMADRGFKDLSRFLSKKDCTLIRPPSVYKSTSCSREDVKQSKRIAALRILVERAINRLREFHMLLPHACIDHNSIPVIDDVIVVACGLINMQDVLIKK